MKKTISLLIIALLLAALPCGCSQSRGEASANTSASVSVEASVSASADVPPSASTEASSGISAVTSTHPLADLLTANQLIDITLSAPEGSGAIRTLTLHYTQDGEDGYAVLEDISRIDNPDYDDEAREQTFTASDYDGDGIVEIIAYREFWFPDSAVPHPGIPLWPTVYEYDLQSGFVIASAEHKDYFEAYIETSEEQVSGSEAYLEDDAKLLLERLIYAAECIVDGSFTPQSEYNDQYYEDVYELTKDING